MEQEMVFDYTIRCRSCETEANLYDIADGVCPVCGRNLTSEKKKLMKVLLTNDVFFDCDDTGKIILPEAVKEQAKTAPNHEATQARLSDTEQAEIDFLADKMTAEIKDFLRQKLSTCGTYRRLIDEFQASWGKDMDLSIKDRMNPQQDYIDTALLVYLLIKMRNETSRFDLAYAVLEKEQEKQKRANLEYELDAMFYDPDDDFDDIDELEDMDDFDELDEFDEMDEFDDADEFDDTDDLVEDWELDDRDDDDWDDDEEDSYDWEDEDDIALEMEETIDDAIMFRGGNPFDWDTRSDYLDDPFGFGDHGDGDDYDY